MQPSEKPAVLAKGEPDKAAAISLLLTLGMWDLMPPEERKAFCEDGEVWDTHCGRELVELIKAAKEAAGQ